jgi:hypothetical protein
MLISLFAKLTWTAKYENNMDSRVKLKWTCTAKRVKLTWTQTAKSEIKMDTDSKE